MQKKILDIVPYAYLPYSSGGQKSIAQFLAFLGKETNLTVFSTADNDFSLATSYTGIGLLKTTFKKYFDTSLVKTITAFVKKENTETLIWEHPYYAWLAFQVRKKTGVQTIFHTHNIEHKRFRSLGRWWWPVLKKYERWCFKKADFLFFINPEERQFAINTWKINPGKCTTIPFGVPVDNFPDDKKICRDKIARLHNINTAEKILFFNGLLNYKPNLDALRVILDQVNPLLLKQSTFRYKIIICGKGLPDEFYNLIEYADKNIIYAGFVDDIEMYFKGVDIFLNPVQTGGGIKTKMVEAIAFGTTVIATDSGAIGIDRTVCGKKLIVTPDSQWTDFASAIINAIENNDITPPSFYETYYWGNIVKKVINLLADLPACKPEND